MRLNRLLSTALLAAVFGQAPALAADAADTSKPKVFVVSTLYKKHETTPAYDLPTLRALIGRLDPDVFVLDVTPTELRERKVWPGKVEYVQVVFPMIEARGATAYASEPAEPLFAELSGPVGAAYAALEKDRPAARAALRDLDAATYAALTEHWRTPGAVNDDLTDRVVGAKRDLENRLVGPVAEANQRRWNEHHAERLLEAAARHPGQRIVMLVGIESRYEVMRLLADAPGIELVDVADWPAAAP
jgi:hypothetical protein